MIKTFRAAFVLLLICLFTNGYHPSPTSFVSTIIAAEATSVNRLPIAFRLDNVQCDYLLTNALTIMDAFIAYNVPLTVSIITGPGSCYAGAINQRLARAPSGLIEIASHSVTNQDITTLPLDQVYYELSQSKAILEAAFPSQSSVVTFVPPGMWNYESVALIAHAGYRILSSTCTADMFVTRSSASQLCVFDMYPMVRGGPFFAVIDQLIHAPIGASTSDFFNGTLLSVSEVLNTSYATCFEGQGKCSILSQTIATASHMRAPSVIPAFAAVKLQPADWSGQSPSDILNYFDSLLPQVIALYSPYTIYNLALLQGSILQEIHNSENSTTTTTTTTPTHFNTSISNQVIDSNSSTVIINEWMDSIATNYSFPVNFSLNYLVWYSSSSDFSSSSFSSSTSSDASFSFSFSSSSLSSSTTNPTTNSSSSSSGFSVNSGSKGIQRLEVLLLLAIFVAFVFFLA